MSTLERAEFETALEAFAAKVVGPNDERFSRDAVLAIYDRIVGERERIVSHLEHHGLPVRHDRAPVEQQISQYVGVLRAERDAAVERAEKAERVTFESSGDVVRWLNTPEETISERDALRAEVAALTAELDSLKALLDGACLCEFCAAKYEALSGDQHRSREIAAVKEQIATFAVLTADNERLRAACKKALRGFAGNEYTEACEGMLRAALALREP